MAMTQMDLFSPSLRILHADPADAAERSEPPRMRIAAAPVTAKPSPAMRERRIADAGEVIPGARRDFYRQAVVVAELTGLSGAQKLELVTKDNVWPVPDYGAWIDAGMPPSTAALAKVLRDSLPIRPRVLRDTGFDRAAERYVAILAELRDRCASARSDDEVIAVALKLYETYRSDGVTAVYKTMSSPLHLSPYDQRKAARLLEAGFPEAREGWKRGCVVTCRGGVFLTYRQQRRVGGSHPTEAAAWAWLKQQREGEQAARRAEVARIPSYPHLATIVRVGPAHRSGVAPEDFLHEFGFRGVQFGNWLPDAERQAVLDHGYAALHDLAWLVGIEPRLIALGGRRPTTAKPCMAIAFGARGRGGRAAAHYESGEVILNMTRLTGAGRVAHEWWHGGDHWLAILGNALEIELGRIRMASGFNAETESRHAALPDLPRPSSRPTSRC